MSRSTKEQELAKSRGRPEGLPKRWSAQRKASDPVGYSHVPGHFLTGVPACQVTTVVDTRSLERWDRQRDEGGRMPSTSRRRGLRGSQKRSSW